MLDLSASELWVWFRGRARGDMPENSGGCILVNTEDSLSPLLMVLRTSLSFFKSPI